MKLVNRSSRAKGPPEAPPMEMYVLRSQILASHNNICSDTHLQSHINAELGLSTRKEKVNISNVVEILQTIDIRNLSFSFVSARLATEMGNMNH